MNISNGMLSYVWGESGFSHGYVYAKRVGNTVSWYVNGMSTGEYSANANVQKAHQMNYNSTAYTYTAIG